MTASVQRIVLAGFEAFALENAWVRAVVLPSLGGRVWELTDRVRDRQWIWHRDDVPLAAAPAGSNYDEVWAGGWEELFPNDAPGCFEGRELPDHGEWWSMAWTVDRTAEGEEAILRLVAATEIRRTACVKEFRLANDARSLVVSYRIESREDEDFHFLFKQHLPILLTPSCDLMMPGGQVAAVDPAFGTLLAGPGPYPWSDAGLVRVPPHSEAAREFVYVDRLPAAWCGVDDRQRRASLRLAFDGDRLPYVWLFLSYGGWRGCYTAVLEPCTNMPKDLAAAVHRGQSARLVPGGCFETRAAVTVGELGAV